MAIFSRDPVPTTSEYTQQPDWERRVLTDLATASLKEQRRSRRWGIVFKILTFTYLFFFLSALIAPQLKNLEMRTGDYTAYINIDGVIADGLPANADDINRSLQRAFKDDYVKGIIMRINSPGGSAVQAGRIYDEILRLREENPDKPVYAVIEDVGASGGYYIAAAAEKIYADRASIVGSIGVRLDTFGVVEAIDKLGIERRSITAGENKALLDPFLPVEPGQVSHLEGMVAEVHEQFIRAVTATRGEKLAPDSNVFSGLIWSGEASVALGLIDALGSAEYIARDVFEHPETLDYTPQQDFFERLSQSVQLEAVLTKTIDRWLTENTATRLH